MNNIAGIDLSASPAKETVIALLMPGKKLIALYYAGTDREIVKVVAKHTPSLVIVDAPMSVSKEPFREQEIKALRDGARLLPLTISSMKKLMKRGAGLYTLLSKTIPKANIFETHPFSASFFLGFKNTASLISNLFKVKLGKDECDAITCCIVGYLYTAGFASSYGGSPPFILPDKSKAVKAVELLKTELCKQYRVLAREK